MTIVMPGACLAAQPTQKPYGSIRLVPQIGLFMKEKKHASVLNALKQNKNKNGNNNKNTKQETKKMHEIVIKHTAIKLDRKLGEDKSHTSV